jgi:signal transduction histidine kinase
MNASTADSPSSSRPRLAASAAIVVFALAVVDLARDFAFLAAALAFGLLALSVSAAVLFLARRRFAGASRLPVLALLIASSAGLAIRLFGYEPVIRRAPEEWLAIRDANARDIASITAAKFSEITSAAQARARALARSPALRGAVASATEGGIAQAFDALGAVALPRAHPDGVPGAALFDASPRPIAWTGATGSLDTLFASRHGTPAPEIVLVERGAERVLVALEPLVEDAGLVSVEVPIAANRRLENRYLRDYDAPSHWAGRAIETDFVLPGGDEERLATLLGPEGEPRWVSEEGPPRLVFALRSDGGKLLGIGAIAEESLETALIDSRRRFALGGSIALVLGAAIALAGFARRSPSLPPLILSIGAFRLVLRQTNFPLGLGLDLDNPAHYASSLFFGFARSPADFLATAATLLAISSLLAHRIDRKLEDTGGARAVALRLLAAPVVVLLFIGVHQVVLDAWLNSNLALADVSLAASDLPRLTIQLGLLSLFAAALRWAYLLLGIGRASLGRSSLAAFLAADGASVLAFHYLLAPRGYSDHALLALIPLAALHLLIRFQDRFRRLLEDRDVVSRAPESILFVIAASVSFYPAVARFESITIRNFIETTVTPVVLNHGRVRMSSLVDTAVAVDRMFEEGRLGDLGREDLAFRIWAGTDLPVSSLSSAVEVVDPSRRVVSSFALGFPAVDLPGEREPAPPEWIPAEHRPEPGHPGFVTARRSFEGPAGERWEIRIRLAADWRNLPFIATPDPYLHLFRAAAVETPLRFPHQELELTVLSAAGEAIFQSTGDALEPGDEVLQQSRRAPLWWAHAHGGESYRTYLVSDGDAVYALSYPEKSLVTHLAELSLWMLLAAGVSGCGLAASLLLGVLGSRIGLSPAKLLHGIQASFSAKLYAAFVLLALLPIASLAVLIRGIVIHDLELDIEQAGIERARVTERLVREIQLSRPASAAGTAPITDAVLERVRTLSGVDTDLYVEGELLATSKPELVASGLLGTRAAPAAHREIVVERRPFSIHRESVGTFEYLVASVPVVLPPWSEPGILSLPLASREAEIERKISSLNQTVLLAAVAFSLFAAGLAYSLARRIAGPINELTEATRAVAGGRLDVSLETSAEDEIGALFSSFNQMTADLKRQREDLEKTKKLEAWAEMARQVAHEVKNPLTPIQLSTQHLLRVYGDDGVDFAKVLRECSETILEQVKALRQISMEFSTFASEAPLELASVDVPSLVRETLAPYQSSRPEGVSIAIEVPSPVPEIQADSRLLKRTLVNLVENALHALDGSGAILVRVSEDGPGFVQIVVADDGIGIEPEMKERVFEPYFSTRAAGTGLGLAIARKVAEDHGGSIALESEPGEGTEVTLRLPIAPDLTRHRAPPPRAAT